MHLQHCKINQFGSTKTHIKNTLNQFLSSFFKCFFILFNVLLSTQYPSLCFTYILLFKLHHKTTIKFNNKCSFTLYCYVFFLTKHIIKTRRQKMCMKWEMRNGMEFLEGAPSLMVVGIRRRLGNWCVCVCVLLLSSFSEYK